MLSIDIIYMYLNCSDFADFCNYIYYWDNVVVECVSFKDGFRLNFGYFSLSKRQIAL